MQTQQAQTENSASSSSAAEAPSLIAINPQDLHQALALRGVSGLLKDVIERHAGELSFDGIIGKIRSQEWIFWVVLGGRDVKAILTTELYFDVGGMKRCRIPFCTGNEAKGWVHLLDHIEQWARSEGCSKLDMIARKGWARHLPDYRMTHVVLEKDLR